MKKIIIIISLFLITTSAALAAPQAPLEVIIFTGEGCPHCAKMLSYLEELKDQYPLNITELEIYHNIDNQYEFLKYAKAFNFKANGVPITIIGNQVINGENYQRLVSVVESCQTTFCPSPQSIMEKYYQNNELPPSFNQETPPINENNAVVWVILLTMLFLAGGLGIFMGRKK